MPFASYLPTDLPRPSPWVITIASVLHCPYFQINAYPLRSTPLHSLLSTPPRSLHSITVPTARFSPMRPPFVRIPHSTAPHTVTVYRVPFRLNRIKTTPSPHTSFFTLCIFFCHVQLVLYCTTEYHTSFSTSRVPIFFFLPTISFHHSHTIPISNLHRSYIFLSEFLSIITLRLEWNLNPSNLINPTRNVFHACFCPHF